MKQLGKILKKNMVPLIIAFVQWLLTVVLQIDRAFFTYSELTKYYFIVKFLYLIFLITAWCFGFHAVNKIKSKDPNYRRGFRIFMVYFEIMMVLLIVLWPGTWGWDDLEVLNEISTYSHFYAWQNIITGIYQDVLLQLLPFPGGFIFLQNVIISLCVAFSVTKLEKSFCIKRIKNFFLDILLKVIPFLLPPVLMYQFSGYRMGLYVYLELVMLVMLVCAVKDKTEWKWSYIILFCFLTVIVAVWRTESLLYIPCICILIFFVNKNIIPLLKKGICILLIIAGFVGMTKWQNAELDIMTNYPSILLINPLGQMDNNNYKVLSLLRPCVEVVRVADEEKDKEELEAIDKVTSLEEIRNHPFENGEWIFWNTNVVKDYNNEEYSNFFKAFVKLCLKYPQVVASERWNLFICSCGLTGPTVTNVQSSISAFYINSGNFLTNIIQSKNWIANVMLFPDIRKTIIYFFGGMTVEGKAVIPLQRILWNALIPIILLVYAWFKFLIRRKWHMWVIDSAILMKMVLVTLTQPSYWFMYFLPFYFLGYVFLVYQIWIYFSNKKSEVENDE